MSPFPSLPPELQSPEASEFPRKLAEFLKSAPLYKPLRFESAWVVPDQFGNLAVLPPAEIDLYCTTCDQIQRFRTGNKIAASGQGIVYLCKNCDKSPMVYFLWVEKAAGMAEVMKVGQYPPLERQPPISLASMMTKEDSDFYRKALTCRNSNFGLAALAYLRRVVENRIDDVLDLIVDAAKALGSNAPELARLTEVKHQKRFTEKIEYATKILPENLKRGGFNPIAGLHDLASEGIHGMQEDECTELFDRCKVAFEYVISNLKVEKERAEDYVRAMRELAKKPRAK